ncbi:unnamed protein product [Rangifer tarandus platyrhynchus]|uniref:Uncharacterized protein n=1 Tax=Rangifer tarandus platyrhynchus TaxID=3082113 RepID=A0AC59YQT8_RANTA
MDGDQEDQGTITADLQLAGQSGRPPRNVECEKTAHGPQLPGPSCGMETPCAIPRVKPAGADTCPAREGSERTRHLLSSLSGSLRGSGEDEDSLGLPTILNADLLATPSIPFPQP